MSNRVGRKRRSGTIHLAWCIGLLWVSTADADTLRIGLAHSSEVDVRCDGPFSLVLGTGGGSPIEQPPGIYTLRVVERASFLRTPPWVAGVIAAPNSPLLVQSAIVQPQPAWRIELLRTTSNRTAERAERDARRRIGGRISSSERDGWILLVAGPFPNEYLANQTLKKARSLGFPARIRKVTTDDLWDLVGASPAPREIRRLVPEGEELVPPRVRITGPEPEQPLPPPSGTYELEPLEPLSPEELDLDPLPTLDPEDLLIEPLPEPRKAELDPALGYRPAPAPKFLPAPQIKRIRPPEPRRPIRRIQPRPLPSTPRTSPPFARPPAPVRSAPPRPLPTSLPRLEEPPLAEAPPPPPPLPPRPRRQEPSPAPSEPKEDPFIYHPPNRGSRIAQGLKSLPIIRRFWWERPLVTPPEYSEEAMERGIDNALQTPAEEAGPPPQFQDTFPPVAEPEDLETEPSTRVALPEIPPTPRPFNVQEARESGVDSGSDTGLIAPLGPTQPGELFPETTQPPSFEEELVPPGPGADDRPRDPLFVPDAQTVPSKPPIGPPEPTRATVPPLPRPPSKRIAAPELAPIARAYVQLFDEDGRPVTDPASAITLEPLTGSHLEYNGNSFHGAFQAYAPSPDWLVLVNEVDVEDYIAGVVPNEIPQGAPLEVLKAQTVLSRCYALLLAQRGEYEDFGYDIPGTPDSEWPYLGRTLETASTRQAARESAGEALVDTNGALATPVYCFSSGGYVADARSVWGGSGEPIPDYLNAHPDFTDPPDGFEVPAEGFANNERRLEDWLTGSPDTYDKKGAGDRFRWTKNLSDRQMDALVNAYWNDQVGEVKEIRITKRAISGHATEMVIEGDDQTVTARDADSIREALGLDSSLIVIKERFGRGWIIYGGGYGHGVGMSQCGAIGLVEQEGANYREILNFYFGKLLLGRRFLVRSSRGA